MQPRSIPIRMFQGMTNVLHTTIPTAISNIQSAVSTFETAIPASKIQSVAETAVPRIASKIQSSISAAETVHCSLGTKQFCVGFSNQKPSCNYFPFAISKIISAIPKEAANLLENEFQALKPLEGILARLTAVHIQIPLIIGLFSLLAMAFLFTYSLFGFWILKTYLKLGACLLCGLICIVLFGIPTVLFYYIQSNINDLGLNLGPNIKVKKGDMGDILIGALTCILVMAILTVVSVTNRSNIT
jgi:hypothetical protein